MKWITYVYLHVSDTVCIGPWKKCVCVCKRCQRARVCMPVIVCKCRLEREWVTNVLLHIAGTIIRSRAANRQYSTHTWANTHTSTCLNTQIKTYCRPTMAFSNKVSSIVEQPNDSHEDRILLLFYLTQRNYTPSTQCKKRTTSFLFHAGCVISTFIRLIKRWPFYEISTDPPLHEVNSRQHYSGVSMEYQCCYLILSIIFLQAATFPLSEETSPLVIWTWWKIFLCKIHEFITFEGIFHYWSIGPW